MSVQVQIPSQLRALADGASELRIEAESVDALIAALSLRHPGWKERLVEPSGEVRRFVRIFVNEEDIRFLEDTKTKLRAGDTVAIVPAIAGG